MLDVIKSYLVSLGFQVDNSSFGQTQQALKNMDKSVATFATSATKQFALAGSAVTTFLVAANVGIAKYMDGLAKADLQNEMFAKRMWMSKESATAYKNAMSALSAEMQDLYLSPELLQRYTQLRKQAEQMAPVDEYSDQMKQIRDVTFEFQRMKLEITYATQWIGYYLYKYLEKPISEFKASMQELNDNISVDMPHWTKQVAQVVSWFTRLGIAGAWGIKTLLSALDDLSPKTKVAGSAFLGFFALLKMGPIGWLIAGVTALLLLMDDFKTYQEGGDSLFGGMWEEVEKLKTSMEDDGTFEGFKESLDGISDSLYSILTNMGEIADKIATNLGFDSFTDMLGQGTLNALQTLEDVFKGIAGALEIIDGILSGDSSKLQSGSDKFAKSANVIMFGRKAGNKLNNAMDEADAGNAQNSISELVSAIIGDDDVAYSMVGQIKDAFTGFGEWLNSIFVSPSLPYAEHADGGIQLTPHLGWVAEDYPESIIPLDPNRRHNSLNLLAQTAGLLGAPMMGSTTNTINNYNVSNNPSYKIYGNEPTATAKAVDRTVDYGLLIRNLRGVN
jgi:hypothetical protein